MSTNTMEVYLEKLKESGFTDKQILDAAKKMYYGHAESRNAFLPSIRCTIDFRQDTIKNAARTRKTLTEYITDAIEDSNNKLSYRADWENDSSASLYKKENADER
jgi:hypothetical protein